MATNINSVGNSLTSQTGTGLFVGSANPALTLPSANNFLAGYSTTVTSGGTTTLTSSSNEQQFFTGNQTQTLTLPVTSTLALGQSYTVVNNSSSAVTVQSSGANVIQAMAGNTSATYTVILTSGTTAASWSYNSSGTTAGINKIIGDNAQFIVGPTATIFTNLECGATVLFDSSGNISQLKVTDTNQNTCIGLSSGGSITSGGAQCTAIGYQSFTLASANFDSVAIGYSALSSDTGGGQNTCVGSQSMQTMNNGFNNTAIGFQTGNQYSGTESNNILIGSSVGGTTGENNVTRIGDGSQTTCFIGGIKSVVVANTNMVTIDTTTGQLGSQAIPTGAITWTGISANQSLVANNGYYVTGGALVLALPAAAATGTIIELVLAGGTSWQITQGAGQSIKIGTSSSTIGVGGSVSSTAAGDSVRLLCTTANLTWQQVSGTQGNPTIV